MNIILFAIDEHIVYYYYVHRYITMNERREKQNEKKI